MENNRILLISTLLLAGLLIFQSGVQAQTYATPELRRQVEENAKRKNAEQGLFLNADKQTAAEKEVELQPVPEFDINKPGLYKLASVTVVDKEGVYSLDEMEDFEKQTNQYFVDMDKGLWYKQPLDKEISGKLRKFTVKNEIIEFADSGPDFSTLKIVELSEYTMTLEASGISDGKFQYHILECVKLKQ